MTVHNHGTEDGPGLACPESRINGELKGKCMNAHVIPEAADPVVAYLNAHFRPEVAADLLAAAQPLMAIAWDEGYTTGNAHNGRRDANPYRSPSHGND